LRTGPFVVIYPPGGCTLQKKRKKINTKKVVERMPSRAVVHIDLDAFFASVELKKEPSLKGRPVVVGADGDPSKRGVVSAASYEARKYGVHSGMPLKKAFSLCPEAAFLPVDLESYERESERFMALLRDYSPLVESFGLDEAFIEVSCKEGADPFPNAVKIAQELKERIRRELRLTASVGVGPNKLIAKMACDMDKPDGFRVVYEKDVEKTLRDLPVIKLWGVGRKTEKRLNDLGIKTIGELARTPIQHLERNFGPNIGRTLHEHARGVDASPVVSFHEPESLSREVTFEEDTGDFYIIKETLYALTEDVAARLKEAGSKGRTVTIKIRYCDFKTITRSVTFDAATDSLNDIWPGTLKLLEAVDFPKPVRLVGVKVAGLE
jgi:DNA polymerase IV